MADGVDITPVREVTTAKRDSGTFISTTAGATSSVNLVANPRAEVSFAEDAPPGWSAPVITSGEGYSGPHVYYARGALSSYPPANGADYFRIIFTPNNPATTVEWEWVSDEIALGAEENFMFGCEICGQGMTYSGTIDDYINIVVRYHDVAHSTLTEDGWTWTTAPGCETEWVRRPALGDEAFDDCGITSPEGVDHAHVVVKYNGDSFVDFGITFFMLDNVATSYAYGDGDSSGWLWSGTPHNSSSSYATPATSVTRQRPVPVREVTSAKRRR